MRMNLIKIGLIILIFYSCGGKSTNKTVRRIETNFESSNSDTVLVKQDPFTKDSVTKNTEKKEAKLLLLDSFRIADFVFLTIKADSVFTTQTDSLKFGNFLINIKKDSLNDSCSIRDIVSKAVSSHYITRDATDKKYFFDVKNLYYLKSPVVLRYSYEFPVEDASENTIFYLEKDKIVKLLKVNNWDYYQNGLKPKRINDSTVKIIYTSRDKFGHFHDDYSILINSKSLNVEFINPVKQKFNFKGKAVDEFTLYVSKEEAKNQRAIRDSFIIKKDIDFQFDSIYWDLNILKITVPGIDSGFVNIDEKGIKIPVNNAC
ncbi:hypothetical protein ACE1ET_04465 [Saccharicrinis sp. FJH62]|uniref:hypothetical protein n=1 Tax=Saccharicrinis sp. FJH62 TaxID=3344657 RepID=UPI0035D4E32A